MRPEEEEEEEEEYVTSNCDRNVALVGERRITSGKFAFCEIVNLSKALLTQCCGVAVSQCRSVVDAAQSIGLCLMMNVASDYDDSCTYKSFTTFDALRNI